MIMKILLVIFILCVHIFPQFDGATFSIAQDKLNRIKRQNPFDNQQPQSNNNFNLANQNGLTVPAFQRLFGSNFLGNRLGTNVDLTNPSVSANQGFDSFGVVNTNQGVNRIGDRGQGNFGGGLGRSVGVLGNQFGAGDTSDVNFNKNTGALNLNRQRGIAGIYTENSEISSNPSAGNFFGTSKSTCIGEMFIKGLCFQRGIGVGKK